MFKDIVQFKIMREITLSIIMIFVVFLTACTVNEGSDIIKLVPLSNNNGGLVNEKYYSIDHEPFHREGTPMDIIYLATEDNDRLEIVKIPFSMVEIIEEYGVDPEINFKISSFEDISELKEEMNNVELLESTLHTGCGCGSNEEKEKRIKIYIPSTKYD